MEFGVVSAASIAGMFFALLVSVGLPIALMVIGLVKYKAKITSFLTGAGVFILFALTLEQCFHLGVFALAGGQDKLMANIWVYGLYGGAAAAVFEETGRWIAMKFFLKNCRDRKNAFMYGVGHGGIEAILIVGLTSISNIATSIAINSGTIKSVMALLDENTRQVTFDQISQLWTLPSYQFFLGGAERIFAIVGHIAMTFFMYKGVKFGKKQYVALAFLYHFVMDFGTVILANYTNFIVVETVLAVFAAAGVLFAYLINKDEENE